MIWLEERRFTRVGKCVAAGHMIECSTYVCGGNLSCFTELESAGGWFDIGYPMAEIGNKGEV